MRLVDVVNGAPFQWVLAARRQYNSSREGGGGAAQGSEKAPAIAAAAVVVTRSFHEIFPQLSDRFNHKYPHNKF